MHGQLLRSDPLSGGSGTPPPASVPASVSGLTPFLNDDDPDGHCEWLADEIAAGRLRPPPERDLEGPAVSISLGDACDLDPGLLAALCGPQGLGGEAVSAAYSQDQAADVLQPGPVLAALTAQAVAHLDTLSDNELIGVLQAARRAAALAGYQQTVAVAEFARRRAAAFEAAKAVGRPVGCRAGEFPGEELAVELVVSPLAASTAIDEATELVNRLPLTLAGMAAGHIDLARAGIIASRTLLLTDEHAAQVDEILAAAAPGKRLDQLARKAAALEMKLAPEAVRERKERARREGQRVEARREESGNASLAGRELDTVEVMASDANIKALAVRLRNSGLIPGTMGQLRARVMMDLLQGRNPLDRLAVSTGNDAETTRDTESAGTAASTARALGDDATPDDATPDGNPPGITGEPAPPPALINLLVPVGTLLNWSPVPAQAVGWGLLDPAETGSLVRAAAKHPRTRWCATLIGADGTAIAHACASGRHPWDPPNHRTGSAPRVESPESGPRAGPSPDQRQQLAGLLRGLNLTWDPVATRSCDHRHAESRYAPSRKLRHLLQARTQTCTAPGCGTQAVHCDIDHSVPWPGGATCQCNTGPKCRRHHRAKQAPGWQAEQPIPDTTQWTLPSGRTHTTGPTTYDLLLGITCPGKPGTRVRPGRNGPAARSGAASG